ncbi:MAG: hypothetical protein QUS14_01070 [Pyrinomonadaceae bacterium]|nr:hypothetical protein [Pyrinomonadaceae bacterium]
MKKALTFLLLTILVCGSAFPVPAQREVQSGKAKRPPLQAPPTTDLTTAFAKGEAFYDGTGLTLVRWQMKAEVRNVAFYVYRLDSEGKSLVSDVAIPGGSLNAGSEPVFDEKYNLVDYNGAPGAVYLIASVSLDGKVITSDPIGSVFVEDLSKYDSDLRDRQRTVLPNSISAADLNLSKELTAEVEKGRLVADPDTHRWVVAQPGVKIGVEKAGLHRVSRAQLEAAGFNVNSDSTLWQLYDEGVQQSLIVGPNGDYIEFLGRGVDTPESDTRA